MRMIEFIKEDKNALEMPNIEIGDIVYVGKFKNRKATVKGFDKDKHNQPILKTDKGPQKLFKPRIKKLEDELIKEEPLVKTDGPMGLTQYQNSSFVLNGGFRSGSSSAGTTRLRYQIFDMKIFDPKKPDEAEVGLVDLFVNDETGDIVGLVNIEFKPKFRRAGRGRQLINDLKDTVKTGFNVHDIQKKAKGFWGKMGTEYTDAAKHNGRIESIEEAKTTRDDDIQHILSMVGRMK